MTGPDDHPPDECPPSTLIIFTILDGCDDPPDDQPPELLELPVPPAAKIPNVADALHTQRARTTTTNT